MFRIVVIFLSVLFLQPLTAQDFVYRTFKDRRVINSQSVETLPKRKLDVRITHRFGDLAGDAGGWPTFYGLENAADVLIGAEYGVTDNLNVGLFRTKGAGPRTQLLNGILKYRVLRQKTEGGSPVTVTAIGMATGTTVEESSDEESINFFDKTAHRFQYFGQILIARKFSDGFALQVGPSWVHRNLVAFGEDSDIISIAVAARIQLTKVFGLIADASFPISDQLTTDNGFYFPIGVGLEIETGGHVFQINLTNARGIVEPDFIANTQTDWLEGQFRLGFTISRIFNL